MKFVREHLETKKGVKFQDKQERPNNIEVEILADTVYLKVKTYLCLPSLTLPQSEWKNSFVYIYDRAGRRGRFEQNRTHLGKTPRDSRSS